MPRELLLPMLQRVADRTSDCGVVPWPSTKLHRHQERHWLVADMLDERGRVIGDPQSFTTQPAPQHLIIGVPSLRQLVQDARIREETRRVKQEDSG